MRPVWFSNPLYWAWDCGWYTSAVVNPLTNVVVSGPDSSITERVVIAEMFLINNLDIEGLHKRVKHLLKL